MHFRTRRLNFRCTTPRHKEQCSIETGGALAPAANHTPRAQPHALSNATPPPAACGLFHLPCPHPCHRVPVKSAVFPAKPRKTLSNPEYDFSRTRQHTTGLATAWIRLAMAIDTTD